MAAQKYFATRNESIKTSYFTGLIFCNTIYYFLKVNETFKEMTAEAFARRAVGSAVTCSLLLPGPASVNSILIFILPFLFTYFLYFRKERKQTCDILIPAVFVSLTQLFNHTIEV
jgi:hypothetical protein